MTVVHVRMDRHRMAAAKHQRAHFRWQSTDETSSNIYQVKCQSTALNMLFLFLNEHKHQNKKRVAKEHNIKG